MKKQRAVCTSITAVLVIIALGACSGGAETRGEAESLEVASIRSLESAFESGSYTEVLQEAQKLDPALGREYVQRAARALLAADESDAAEARSMRRSYIRAQNYFPFLEKLKAEEDLPFPDGVSPVAALYERGAEIQEMSDGELLEYSRQTVLEELKSLALAAQRELSRREIASGDELSTFLERGSQRAAELLDAVVTVWVDRGMRIQEGVGRPDRVIGSGFFIDKRGYLLTNYHVIASEVDRSYEGFSRLYIRLSDNTEVRVPARVVGYSENFDLALLKAEIEPKQILSFSQDSKLEVGQKIYAIGSPGGLENTITSGIVSSVGRKILQMGDYVQVDVPINRGNSGGPLLNTSGELVGIVFSGIEQFEGINFAIPASWAQRLLGFLYRGDAYPHVQLGVSLKKTDMGLEVVYVAPQSPAKQLDIKTGDILLSINGKSAKSISGYQGILLDMLPGELLSVRWLRDGRELSYLLRAQKREAIPFERYAEIDLPEALFPPLFGMEVERIGGGLLADNYTINRVYPGSVADESGLSPGDPFSLRKWELHKELPVLVSSLRIKKRKAGFLESGIQLAAYLETDNFL